MRKIRLKPTEAMRAGESEVAQCTYCGALICFDRTVSEGATLGPCPACGNNERWWSQDCASVGPFVGSSRRESKVTIALTRRQAELVLIAIDYVDGTVGPTDFAEGMSTGEAMALERVKEWLDTVLQTLPKKKGHK